MVMKRGVMRTIQRQNGTLSAHYRVSSTKEGSNEQIKDEIDARFFTLKVLSIRSSYHPDGQSTLHFTWKCLNG